MTSGLLNARRGIPMNTRLLKITAIVLLGAASAGIALANTLTVDAVLSGDVVRFGETFVARLTGIRAPSKDTEIGHLAFEFTKREIEGKLVRVFTWTTDNTAAGIVWDDDGKAFVQICYGDDMETSLNEVLLLKGYARVDEERLPEELEHYLEIEKEAREKGLGIWADAK
jgi:endonuclease YncB( thermonuclease family)